MQVGQVTAVAWPKQLDLAIRLAELADRPADWPGLGRLAPGPIRLVVVPDARRLDSLTRGRAPQWGAAVALPADRTIVIRADGGDLHRTLRHELAHLALHQRVPVRVPLWFDEGYAGWAAGEWERLGVLELNLAVARGALPGFRGLDGALRASENTADAAYALAYSAVSELARRNPSGSLGPLLQRLQAGEDFDEAVLATTGMTVDRFEEAWQRSVRHRYGLVTWLLAGGGWLLVAVAVLVLVHFRRRADRPRRAALDEGWVIDPEAVDGQELDPTRER
ncbi:MAG TPA: peptidase MA family metallohydrolase [Gemmatimonadales bacterium]